MQYALVDNERYEPFPGGRGFCPICSSPAISKCGPRVVHHWAHASRKDCDPWWENETLWHREWKALFPENCREISYTAPNGEVHRADIVTPTGIVIKVQHSAMSDMERQSREAFYKNLIWIIDGSGFRKNFDIYHLLPDPASEIAQDLVWTKATRSKRGAAQGLFFRLSEGILENPDATKATLRHGTIHGIHEIEASVHEAYRGHHQYDWIRPHRTWLDAACPVYIDLGENFLAKLDVYDESGLKCIHRISKQKFIHDVLTETTAGVISYPSER